MNNTQNPFIVYSVEGIKTSLFDGYDDFEFSIPNNKSINSLQLLNNGSGKIKLIKCVLSINTVPSEVIEDITKFLKIFFYNLTKSQIESDDFDISGFHLFVINSYDPAIPIPSSAATVTFKNGEVFVSQDVYISSTFGQENISFEINEHRIMSADGLRHTMNSFCQQSEGNFGNKIKLFEYLSTKDCTL